MNAPLLHRFLGIGLLLVAVALIIARQATADPEDPSNAINRTIGYALAGMTVIQVCLALLVFKPRVPDRKPGQTVQQYWADPVVASRALLVWLILEGAGIVSAIGYFLSGEPVVMFTLAAAILAFWFTGPNVFAKA